MDAKKKVNWEQRENNDTLQKLHSIIGKDGHKISAKRI
jgi:hypothetical protein